MATDASAGDTGVGVIIVAAPVAWTKVTFAELIGKPEVAVPVEFAELIGLPENVGVTVALKDEEMTGALEATDDDDKVGWATDIDCDEEVG